MVSFKVSLGYPLNGNTSSSQAASRAFFLKEYHTIGCHAIDSTNSVVTAIAAVYDLIRSAVLLAAGYGRRDGASTAPDHSARLLVEVHCIDEASVFSVAHTKVALGSAVNNL